MRNEELQLRYLRRLEVWPASIRRYLYVLPERPELGCYGPGEHGNWSMQANNTALGTFAVLATDPRFDRYRAGMSRDEILAWALRMLRFTLFSHHSGGGAAMDNKPWGHTWISALCLERMMHGMEALTPHLTDEDKEGFERLLVSECNWLLDCYHRGTNNKPGRVTAGLVKNNTPENNIWNGCLLNRTALLYPATPRREEYLEKGTAFLLNGISIEADAVNSAVIAGKPLSAWHVDANFFSSYALNHHGYLNIGYMAICLSNIAMLHFSCRANNWKAPEGLYHHARELWQLVKTCTFPDGRLWRIGGDTRVRYCYCQDYAIPTWLLARDLFGDPDAEQLESGWLSILDKEAAANPDNAFLSARLSDMEAVSPLYYTRLEGDRAVSLSMGACWRRTTLAAQSASEQTDAVKILGNWSDEYHGSAMVRGSNRMASWTWRSANNMPHGQCLPPRASSMAEWQGNLAGYVRGLGLTHHVRSEICQHRKFDGGFVCCGRMITHSSDHLGEGEAARDIALTDQVCIALPDDRTLVVLQRARVTARTWLRSVKGLYLPIPNDIFNNKRRTAMDDGGAFFLNGLGSAARTRAVNGNWLNIDGCLSVIRIYGPGLAVHQPAGRQIVIPGKEAAGGHLYADEICCGCTIGLHAADAGTTLFDLGTIILAGVDGPGTQTILGKDAPRAVSSGSPAVRTVTVTGADGCRYLIMANFSDTETTESLGSAAGGDASFHSLTADISLRDSDGNMEAVIPAGHAALLAPGTSAC